jgi:uncharacterized protein (DUF885 family)
VTDTSAIPPAAAGAPTPIDALAGRFWESFLQLHPTTATMYGDSRYDDRLDDPGPAGRAAIRKLAEDTRAEAQAIDPVGISTEDRITRDMLIVLGDLAVAEDDLHMHRLRAVDQIAGPQAVLPQVATLQPADTPERLESFLGRLRAYGPYMDAYEGIVRESLESGVTAPRIVTERTIEQLKRLLATPLDQAVIPAMARVATDADRERVRAVVGEVVIPKQQAYLELLEREYLAQIRDEPGLWAAPDGDALYRQAIRSWTTLDLEPQDVHRIGLEELATIDEERRALAGKHGFGDDVVRYRESLASQPQNVPQSRVELVARATEDIGRAADLAPTWFGRTPRAACEVRPVEEFKEKDAPFAYYYPPTVDGSRPGIYYVNAYDLPSRTYLKLASTTYHEAIPGHHFQIALEIEHPSLNVFRRLGSRLVGGAFAEGWGLYSERLADEMGLYRDDGERLGMLDALAWRAGRLVVDSGMHGLRWSRQQSIDFLLKAGLSNTDAVIETDRYIVWPGQALTYMIGMREIRRLRREIEQRDGAAFDIRAFHDAVLGHGSLPLATLARELPRWVPEPAGAS